MCDDDGDVERWKTGWLPGDLAPRLAVGLRKRDGWADGRGFIFFFLRLRLTFIESGCARVSIRIEYGNKFC